MEVEPVQEITLRQIRTEKNILGKPNLNVKR